MERLFEHQDVVVLVGGSGLYADALIEGLDQFPEVPQALRDQLELFYQQHGLEGLQDLLKQKDLKYYQQVDRNNPRRMLRALGCVWPLSNLTPRFCNKKRSRETSPPVTLCLCPKEKNCSVSIAV